MRSANPLLGATETKKGIRASTGQGTRDTYSGYGMPRADYAVNWALSLLPNGTSDVQFADGNRTTPLFAVYSSVARSHFFSTAPQQIVSALTGTLRPAPVNWIQGSQNQGQPKAVTLTQSSGPAINCGYNGTLQCPRATINGGFRILQPGGAQYSGVAGGFTFYIYVPYGAGISVTPGIPDGTDITCSNAGYIKLAGSDYIKIRTNTHTDGTWDADCLYFNTNNFSIPAYVATYTEVPSQYESLSGLGTGYPNYTYPCYFSNRFHSEVGTTFDQPGVCGTPRAVANIYTTEYPRTVGGNAINVVPLYRLTFRCGASASILDSNVVDICTNGASGNFNPRHVAHVFALTSELTRFTTRGYVVDGIEGYVFPSSYSSAQLPTGAIMVCRSYNSSRDDWMLTVAAAGQGCPGAVYSEGAYYTLDGSDKLFWAIQNPLPATDTATINVTTYPAGRFVRIVNSASANFIDVYDGQSVTVGVGSGVTNTFRLQPQWNSATSTNYYPDTLAYYPSTNPNWQYSYSMDTVLPVTAGTTWQVSGFYTPFTPYTLDIDANGVYDALTDGYLNIRYDFGNRSDSDLTPNAVGPDAIRYSAAQIVAYLDAFKLQANNLDVDGNGVTDALTDGLMVIRYMFGLRGSSLISGAVANNATRTTAAAIEAYLQQFYK